MRRSTTLASILRLKFQRRACPYCCHRQHEFSPAGDQRTTELNLLIGCYGKAHETDIIWMTFRQQEIAKPVSSCTDIKRTCMIRPAKSDRPKRLKSTIKSNILPVNDGSATSWFAKSLNCIVQPIMIVRFYFEW